MAESVLAYFDTRFKKDANGKIVLSPTQAVETVLVDVINDAPTTAGLNNITSAALCLARAADHCRAACFLRQDEGRLSRRARGGSGARRQEGPQTGARREVCEPAEQLRESRSCMPIWPFRLYGLGKPGLEEAVAAYAHRLNHLDVGWGYDGNCAALLGLTDEAARILKVKCANSHPAYRWPATWGPNFDWLPDQDHGSNLLETTQFMLLQSDGDVIRLLPAWPKNWDVQFKLHAPHQTTVECVYRGGKIEQLRVEPESRRKDVVCSLAPLPCLKQLKETHERSRLWSVSPRRCRPVRGELLCPAEIHQALVVGDVLDDASRVVLVALADHRRMCVRSPSRTGLGRIAETADALRLPDGRGLRHRRHGLQRRDPLYRLLADLRHRHRPVGRARHVRHAAGQGNSRRNAAEAWGELADGRRGRRHARHRSVRRSPDDSRNATCRSRTPGPASFP